MQSGVKPKLVVTFSLALHRVFGMRFDWSTGLPVLFVIGQNETLQEPITRSPQLPHIPVTAFSQPDLFLV